MQLYLIDNFANKLKEKQDFYIHYHSRRVALILIAIPANTNFLNGYALNGSVLVGYVLKMHIGGICL